ncbi:hypothetical protein K501DRAFT_278816 [Backusella circina FSU 941]|nr:hypothetical protein K501DRAFT_278816 [Backusella circina FSU 941]
MRMIKSLVQNQYIWYMLQRIYVPSQSAITGYQYREKQGYIYSNRKVALDFISNVVINKTTTEEPIMLQLHQLESQRTVVAYGDANFLSIKGHSPAPVKMICIGLNILSMSINLLGALVKVLMGTSTFNSSIRIGCVGAPKNFYLCP